MQFMMQIKFFKDIQQCCKTISDMHIRSVVKMTANILFFH